MKLAYEQVVRYGGPFRMVSAQVLACLGVTGAPGLDQTQNRKEEKIKPRIEKKLHGMRKHAVDTGCWRVRAFSVGGRGFTFIPCLFPFSF